MPEMCIPFHLIQIKKRGRPPCHQARYRSFARITLARFEAIAQIKKRLLSIFYAGFVYVIKRNGQK
ncbi:hypothetical protein AT808_05950 [Salmonella enterica]|nr:hypothetical protein [Salmonella enterica]EBA3657421.1 hypothetical protein [Salmonella enterica]EBA3666530.1 hypothetical protein [Salmonella enterica]